jgi:hypothetical protein
LGRLRLCKEKTQSYYGNAKDKEGPEFCLVNVPTG